MWSIIALRYDFDRFNLMRITTMAYKLVQCKGTVSSISDAFSAIEELGSEMRETYDNMEGANMGHMSKCEMAGEAADTLEGFSEPDVPEFLQDIEISYSESVNKRKGASCSRAVRLANACAVFEAACAAIEQWLDDNESASEEQREEAEQLKGDIEEICNEAEGVEFPGMFG